MRKNINFCVAASVSFITFITYLPALKNGFVHWDDDIYVTGNPFIRSLGLPFFKWAFSSFYASNWHPLTWLSHAVDYALWGLNPTGHHLTNIIIHAVNTFLVVVLAIKLLEIWKRRVISEAVFDQREILITAGVTGLLFGLHPLHVESVAWVAERKDLLCAMFFSLSILAYTYYIRDMFLPPADRVAGPAVLFQKWYLLSLGFFLLSLLSKPMAVSLPFVLLILDWFPAHRISSVKTLLNAVGEKLSFLLLGLVSSVLTILAQQRGGATGLMEIVPLPKRIAVAAKASVVYLWKMVVPENLIPLYQYPRNATLLSVEYLSMIILILGISALLLCGAKKWKLPLALWSYYFLTLLPVLGIVQVGGQAMADRYTYLPSCGPFLALGLASVWISRILGRRSNILKLSFGAVIVSLLVSMAYLTSKQIGIWHDDLTLWSAVIEKAPNESSRAYFLRGLTYERMGVLDKAAQDYNASIATEPFHAEAFIHRGALYGEAGEFEKAIEYFDTAIKIEPGNSEAYGDRGYAYALSGERDLALADYNKAIQLNGSFAMAYLNRGNLYMAMGDKEHSLSDFRRACELGSIQGCAR
jgi:tetratricopeptide (TPR) repeat protein